MTDVRICIIHSNTRLLQQFGWHLSSLGYQVDFSKNLDRALESEESWTDSALVFCQPNAHFVKGKKFFKKVRMENPEIATVMVVDERKFDAEAQDVLKEEGVFDVLITIPGKASMQWHILKNYTSPVPLDKYLIIKSVFSDLYKSFSNYISEHNFDKNIHSLCKTNVCLSL
jgi:DNA-binding NtrC family response regulator